MSSLRVSMAAGGLEHLAGGNDEGAAVPPLSSSNIRDMRTWGEINQAIKQRARLRAAAFSRLQTSRELVSSRG